jgi:hypothetical protein
VTYLLRNPSGLETDEKLQPYIKSGQARLLKGNSLNESDVRRAWEQAGKGGAREGLVDYLLSTVGQSNPTHSLTCLLMDQQGVEASRSRVDFTWTLPTSALAPCVPCFRLSRLRFECLEHNHVSSPSQPRVSDQPG